MGTVTADKIAQALNLSERRVHQLVREAGLPKQGRGQFDPMKCMLFYIRYLQDAIEKKTVPTLDGGFVGERKERMRLLSADADLKEMELAKQRSQLVAIQDVEGAVADLVRTTTARVMVIPPRLAPELVGETSRMMIQAKLERAFRETLAHLARSHNAGGNANGSARQHPRANSTKREAPSQ
jgi:phage terminase Nu1 subunit (DNA packaging protein)